MHPIAGRSLKKESGRKEIWNLSGRKLFGLFTGTVSPQSGSEAGLPARGRIRMPVS